MDGEVDGQRVAERPQEALDGVHFARACTDFAVNDRAVEAFDEEGVDKAVGGRFSLLESNRGRGTDLGSRPRAAAMPALIFATSALGTWP